MEVPAKFRSVWSGFRYLLLALVLITTSALLISCGSGGTTITINDGTGGGRFKLRINLFSECDNGRDDINNRPMLPNQLSYLRGTME